MCPRPFFGRLVVVVLAVWYDCVGTFSSQLLIDLSVGVSGSRRVAVCGGGAGGVEALEGRISQQILFLFCCVADRRTCVGAALELAADTVEFQLGRSARTSRCEDGDRSYLISSFASDHPDEQRRRWRRWQLHRLIHVGHGEEPHLASSGARREPRKTCCQSGPFPCRQPSCAPMRLTPAGSLL